MEAITVQIAKLELSPGDMLAVMVPKVLHIEQRLLLKKGLEVHLPPGVKALVLDGGMTLATLTSADLPEEICKLYFVDESGKREAG